jgi:hypothetical protein
VKKTKKSEWSSVKRRLWFQRKEKKSRSWSDLQNTESTLMNIWLKFRRRREAYLGIDSEDTQRRGWRGKKQQIRAAQ